MTGIFGKIAAWPEKNRCGLLTALMVLFFILSALASPRGAADRLLQICFYMVMIFAPYFVSRNRRLGQLALIGGAVLLLPHAIAVFAGGVLPSELRRLTDIFTFLVLFFELLLTAIVMRYSLSSESRDEPVWGCVLTFLLIAVVFGNVYFLIAEYFPGAFAENGRPLVATLAGMRYFSLITLTTCGFGDIAPVMPLARIISGLEAVTGVMYAGLFIGRVAADKLASCRR